MGTLENLKEIADVVKKLGNIELYRKIVELEGEVIELTRDNRKLEEENHKLGQQLEFKTKLHFTEPFWYAEGDAVPFCPSCYEANKLPVHLHYQGEMMGGHRYDCPNCKHTFCSKFTPPPRMSQNKER